MILKNILTTLFLILLSIRPFLSSLAFPFEDIIYSILFLFVAILLLISEKKIDRILKHPATLFIALFLFAIILSTIFSKNMANSLSVLYKFSLPILVFYVVVSYDTEKKRILTLALLLTCGLVSFSALQWLLRGHINTINYLQRHHVVWNFAFEYLSRGRAFTPFVLPSSLGSYLILFLPLSFVLLFKDNKLLEKPQTKLDLKNIFFLSLVLVISIALLSTQSLGALLSLALALCLFIFTQKAKIKKQSFILAISGLAVCGLLLFILRNSDVHFFNVPLFSITSRLSFWKQAIHVIGEHPFTGAGLGNYPFFKSTSPHNSYLQIWAETGILGLAALLGIIYQTHKIAFLTLPDSQRNIYTGLWIGSLAFLIHNLIDFTFFQPEVALQWWVIAALLSSLKEDKPEIK